METATRRRRVWGAGFAAILLGSVLAAAAIGPHANASFAFSTGGPDGRMAMASRPSGVFSETEAADDFILSASTSLTQATFTGLLPPADPLTDVQQVIVEIYRVFPQDSNVGRTSGPPVFSTSQVPTRVNSPSDVAFDSRDSGASGLTFSASVLATTFTATNSVNTGINPVPNQRTNGEGAVTGEEVQFTVNFTPKLSLPAGHYFFVPQVGLGSTHVFYWLSAPHPQFSSDLQAWIRNAALDPDWLRVGTDIVGGSPAPTFDGSFSLTDAKSATVINGGTVSGNVIVRAGTALDIENATVLGSVTATRAASVRICNSTIQGSITATKATGLVFIGDGGDDGGSCPGNHTGRVTLSRNRAGVEFGGNTSTSLTLGSTTGGSGEEAAPEVEANHISKSLSCFGNSPAPTNDSRPNTVGGSRGGQCNVPGF